MQQPAVQAEKGNLYSSTVTGREEITPTGAAHMKVAIETKAKLQCKGSTRKVMTVHGSSAEKKGLHWAVVGILLAFAGVWQIAISNFGSIQKFHLTNILKTQF